jgi:helicase-like protein
MTADDGRAAVLAYMERQLVGPWDGDSELITERPQRRYLTGILFPYEASKDQSLDDEIADDTPGFQSDDEDDPVVLAGQLLPSSVALSFVMPRAGAVRVTIRAGRYHKEGGGWRRHPVQLDGDRALVLEPPVSLHGRTRTDVDTEGISVDAVWRPFPGGTLLTVALVNRREAAGGVNPEDCLLQVSMRCSPVNGTIGRYPSAASLSSDAEEEELTLLYRDVPTFAVGHGAAAIWPPLPHHSRYSDTVAWVQTSYLPIHEVPGIDFTLPDLDRVLSLTFLITAEHDPTTVISALDTFIDGYDRWAEELATTAADLQPTLMPAAQRLLDRLHTVRIRMRRGLRLLADNPGIRSAFCLTNEAMLMQMVHARAPYASRRQWTDPVPPADYTQPQHRWRPFQLAFLLLTMESLALEESPERAIVDLLWFPTGGGKTEAYLAAVAFSVFRRRLRHGDNGDGVTAITRYTLRLLTAQQFQRAAALVCACELVRRRHPGQLGSVPITIGIWVGGTSSPNTYQEAVQLLERVKGGERPSLSFQLNLCPWCATELLPEGDVPDEAWGVACSNDSFAFRCPNSGCDFRHGLPVSSVDDDLYRNPPTVLIGTVDKFARLAWDARAGVFLGAGRTPGPSLIIQDEFHLISGPLGTMVGLYEAAFDVAMAHNGARPKVIASTATIRRADEQARGVFGRDVSLFPPAGLTADDSYFVRYDRQRPGRLYVGIMPQGHTPLTAMVHVSAALLQAPVDEQLEAPFADAYWTLVAYHNSLRELGKTVTLAHDDIPARLQVIAETEDDVRTLDDDGILELTSNISATDINRNLERLAASRDQRGAASFVASTNMISVGVDVSRLGLMLVVGQPKTSAEYVQATSRVGRNTPGLVFTLYSPSKPRDRSHYETFVPYHSALYRFVEPTSVTPFSIPARTRALHAGLVVLARHARGWAENDDAAGFDATDPRWAALVEAFLRRVDSADREERFNVERHLKQMEDYWSGLIDQAGGQGGLRYRSAGKGRIGLLRKYQEAGSGWPTLDSMRSVDVEVRMSVKGADR